MGEKLKYSIVRTYDNEPRDILDSAQIIHRYLFSTAKSVSKYRQSDADKLTEFFREIKKISQSEPTEFGEVLKKDLMISEFENSIRQLGLDFTKGGKSSGGIEFEKEIQKLVTQSDATGQSTAVVLIDLGAKSIEQAEKKVAKLFDTTVDELAEWMKKNIVPGTQFNASSPQDYYLKIGVKRFGKSDFQSGAGAQISFSVEGNPIGNLKDVKNMLLNASFSIKSYKTDREVHLGNTSKKKAVSAVAEYVAEHQREKNARWAGLYFLDHPEEKVEKYQKREEVRELYQHYGHMRSVYELTGLGLRYENDLEKMTKVDFLLVNRAYEGGDIKVWSTQELIQRFASADKYVFSLDV